MCYTHLAMASKEFIEQRRKDESEQRKRNFRDCVILVLLFIFATCVLAALGVKVDATKFVR